MEVDDESCQAICVDVTRMRMRVRLADDPTEREIRAPKSVPPDDEPFELLAAVLCGKTRVQPADLSSLENNPLVMDILEAAKTSAKSGKTVELEYASLVEAFVSSDE